MTTFERECLGLLQGADDLIQVALASHQMLELPGFLQAAERWRNLHFDLRQRIPPPRDEREV